MTVPSAPPQSSIDPLVGRYQLEIQADSRTQGLRCELMPSTAISRTYVADIHALEGRHAVRLYDAAFLADSSGVSFGCGDARLPQTGSPVCHQFLLTGDSTALSLTVEAEDEWRGATIWEALPGGTQLLQIRGRATGSLRDGRIEATGTGSIWYGQGLPAVQFYACESGALRFTFNRR